MVQGPRMHLESTRTGEATQNIRQHRRRDQTNAGDAPGRGWGMSLWAEGEVRILSSRTREARLPVDYRIRHRPILRVPRKHGKRCTSVIVFAKGVLVARMRPNTEEFQVFGGRKKLAGSQKVRGSSPLSSTCCNLMLSRNLRLPAILGSAA